MSAKTETPVPVPVPVPVCMWCQREWPDHTEQESAECQAKQCDPALLHPDLIEWLEPTDELGMILRHPLVYQVPFISAPMANSALEKKLASLRNARKDNNFLKMLWLHERPYRIHVPLDLGEDMDDETYWNCLRHAWNDSENTWAYLDVWRQLWTANRPGRDHAMDPSERAYLARLPALLTVYRGCILGLNEHGMAWTLDPSRAEWFSGYKSYRGGEGVVLTGMLAKEDVLAYLSDRNESEIVTLPQSVVIVHSALAPLVAECRPDVVPSHDHDRN